MIPSKNLARTLARCALGAFAGLGLSIAAAAAPTPDEVVRSTSTALQADITQNIKKYQADKTAFYAMVDQRATSSFDTAYIAKVILGTHLKEATPDQVAQFETAFKDMLIHNYADTLLQYYDNVDIDVKPARIDGDGKRANVDAVIQRKDGKPPIPLTFSMRNSGGAWKVWDIKAENISVVLNFRTQMDAEIKSSNIASVIDRLHNGKIELKKDSGQSASE